MKYLFVIFLFVSYAGYGQLSMDSAKIAARKYRIGSYDYHEQFTGHAGYGAPIILTADGGTAFFGGNSDSIGNHGLLVKLDKNGREEWKKAFRPQFDELETQSVTQDRNGNYYVFMITYNYKLYRGGPERVVCIDKKGTILWDKTIGSYSVLNSPMVSYIRALNDGRIEMRGHVVIDKPIKGRDPEYRYWEGWFDSEGKLTQKTGDVIDWKNQDWKKLYEPKQL